MLCYGHYIAIQQKVDNVILLPGATAAHPYVHSMSLY